jgi:DNA polymerase
MGLMKSISIDIETYSSNDLKTSGVYKYIEAEDFEILLFAYSVDGGQVEIVDLALGEKLPREINHALLDPEVTKYSFNAQFERVCISRYFHKLCLADQWQCTMVKGAMLGLPMSLDQVGKVLKLDTQKDSAGKALIRYFTMPCKPTAANGMRTRNLPVDDFEKWDAFKAYCVRDVEVEQAIRDRLAWFQIPEQEKDLYTLDQKINDTGIDLDPVLIKNAIQMDADYSVRLNREAVQITGLENPNSPAQLKKWIGEKEDVEIDSLNKEAIPGLIGMAENDEVKRMLELRTQMAKSSIKKYQAMTNCLCGDSRAHGMFQFYGASRTGRWSGRLIQLQNLYRISMPDIDMARSLVRTGQMDVIEMVYDSLPEVLSQLVRTAFTASYDHRLIVADFSAIEARVIAWLAGEKWRLEVFQTHGKIYEASASAMFHVPIHEITKENPLRQKGKIAELALGYGGSVGALEKMGALRMGLTEGELPNLVARWRGSNRRICAYWGEAEEAAMEAVENGSASVGKGIRFHLKKGILFCRLPSGRELAYYKPELRPGKFGNTALCYQGMDQTTKQWRRVDTFGGKLVENIVQAVSRDLLAEAMLRLDKAGYSIVGHVHDEIIIDQRKDSGSLEDVIKIMTTAPAWAKGLPLAADGFESEYYKK